MTRYVWSALAGSSLWWAIIEGSSWGSALLGAALGLVLARIYLLPAGGRRTTPSVRKVSAVVRLAVRFTVELVVANLLQLRLVLAPRVRVRPEWLELETALESPRLRALLGLLISLTPGTITADLDGNRLTLHLLDSDDPEAVRRRIRQRFESPLLELES